jgi:glucose/arabinose dehydrogenase
METSYIIVILVCVSFSVIAAVVGWMNRDSLASMVAPQTPQNTPQTNAPQTKPNNWGAQTTLMPNANVGMSTFATLPGSSGVVTCIVPGPGSALLATTQNGKVYKVTKNKAEEWLDVSPDLNTQSEAGLLDICLQPDFTSSGIFFTKHINRKNEIVICRGKGDANRGGNLQPIFTTPHAANGKNHYGGGLHIASDGLLYFAIGDCEVKQNASDDASYQGKVLKMNTTGGTPSVVVKGLRNPWRTNFAPNGDLYIADVGSDRSKGKERVFVAKTNLKSDCGWPETEDPSGGKYLTPIISWATGTKGQCIIGGVTYRGSKAALKDTYIYGAFKPSDIFAYNLTTKTETKIASVPDGRNTAIGEDANGEVYFGTENVIYSI